MIENLLDQSKYVGIIDTVEVAASFPAGDDHTGEAQFAQVLAGRGDADPDPLGKGADAIGMLISAKVNQWTLLVGSLPVAYLFGGGTTVLNFDARQIEEFLLTATQTLLGTAALLMLRFPRWAAWTLLGLFAVQFAFPGQTARYVLAMIYAASALAALIHNRQHIVATLTAPFRRDTPDDPARAGERTQHPMGVS